MSQWEPKTLGPLSVHSALKQGQALQLVREITPRVLINTRKKAVVLAVLVCVHVGPDPEREVRKCSWWLFQAHFLVVGVSQRMGCARCWEIGMNEMMYRARGDGESACGVQMWGEDPQRRR